MSEDRARQGIEHLQAAAVEVIGAMRAFLDIAEDVIRDSGAAASFASSLVDVVRPDHDGEAPSTEPRVTRIRVS